ncbi:hypothetical protein [Echinicola salinicaeni]
MCLSCGRIKCPRQAQYLGDMGG